MLSRVAERVYWLARYLERIENTARLVNVHTSMLLDFPVQVEFNWYTLIALFDLHERFRGKHRDAEETTVMRFLLADTDNASALSQSVLALRENARTTIDILPEDLWEQVNELHLSVQAELSSLGNRRRRQRFLLDVMNRCQTIWGILDNHMSRNQAYDFLQLGKYIERADMTSRILEMGALIQTENRSASIGQYRSLLWSHLLRALCAQQMYTQTYDTQLDASTVLQFLLHDKQFPRSIRFALDRILGCLHNLSLPELVTTSHQACCVHLESLSGAFTGPAGMHAAMDTLQIHTSALNQAITQQWFNWSHVG